MGVSIYARKGKDLLIDVECVDMAYGNFYSMMAELQFETGDDSGTVGQLPITQFRDALEANYNGWHPEAQICLLKLCRLGIERGADTISWA